MNKIVTKAFLFIAVAGITFTAHAGDPSFYDNERDFQRLAPLDEMAALDES